MSPSCMQCFLFLFLFWDIKILVKSNPKNNKFSQIYTTKTKISQFFWSKNGETSPQIEHCLYVKSTTTHTQYASLPLPVSITSKIMCKLICSSTFITLVHASLRDPVGVVTRSVWENYKRC